MDAWDQSTYSSLHGWYVDLIFGLMVTLLRYQRGYYYYPGLGCLRHQECAVCFPHELNMTTSHPVSNHCHHQVVYFVLGGTVQCLWEEAHLALWGHKSRLSVSPSSFNSTPLTSLPRHKDISQVLFMKKWLPKTLLELEETLMALAPFLSQMLNPVEHDTIFDCFFLPCLKVCVVLILYT